MSSAHHNREGSTSSDDGLMARKVSMESTESEVRSSRRGSGVLG